MLWINILCSHLQRFRKWKSPHDLSINNINDQNIGINLFMGTLYFCSILQGVYAPYSECCAHLYRYALDCDSVCVLLIWHLKLCHGCQSPFFVTLFCSHLYYTLIGQVFINLSQFFCYQFLVGRNCTRQSLCSRNLYDVLVV